MNVLTDMMALRIAPTPRREITAQLLGLVLVTTVAFLFAERPAVQYGLPVAYAIYATIRVVLAFRAGD